MKTKHKHWAVITASTLGLTGLVSAANLGVEKYTYDGSGNIVEKSIDGQVTKLAYDASNKVTSISSASKCSERISYDAAHRPVFYKDVFGQASRHLSYGYGDKVLQATNASNKSDFFYNAEGQLVGKLVNGRFTPYTWDGNVMAAEGAEAFTNEAHIAGGVPAMTGGQSVIVSDYLGNTLSQGNAQFTSTAYGGGLEQGRFTGKPFIKELGSFLFQHRMYSLETNRWTVADPMGFPDGANNYLYVNGNPITKVDPLGTLEEEATVSVKSNPPKGQTVVHGTIKFKYTYTASNAPVYVVGSAKAEIPADPSILPPLPLPVSSVVWSMEKVEFTPAATASPVTGAPQYEHWEDNNITLASALYKEGNDPSVFCQGTGKFTSPAWEK